MDRFSKVITTNKMSIKAVRPLPNRPSYSEMDISFDKYIDFINWYLSSNNKLPLLSTTIYDEASISSQEDINLRYQFLKLLNELDFKEVFFNLSDSTLPVYNEIMQMIGWKHFDKTKLFMTIDRNPKDRKNLKLLSAQGKIMLREESLIWESTSIISQLQNKVNDDTIKKAIELKEIVFQYYMKLNSLYYTEKFTKFDKVWLVYDCIKTHISFASEATRMENGRQVLYNPQNKFDWVSQPLGTYEHKRGVCEGQARLMQSLLNNQYLRSDTATINGTCPLGNHVWVGTVIDDKLFQTCLTMAGPFKDLQARNYIAYDNEAYPKLYASSSLNNEELLQIQSHIKRLRKK